MKIDTKNEVHPILVADLAKPEHLARLHEVAARRGHVLVPLLSAPVDRRTHILECYAPGGGGPVMFLAEPLGPPTERGYPLKLEPYEAATTTDADEVPEHEDDGEPPTPASLTRAAPKNSTSPNLSARHTRDLEQPQAAPAPAPAPATDSLYVGRLLAGGKYHLDALVGAGGMGAVYRGRHCVLDKEVAVKVLHATFQFDAEFSKRFHAEALTMSKIDHPNVTRILDFGQEEDGLLYLVMEFLEGVDLQAVLDQEGALPLERAVRIMSGVCAGLLHVHRHGIIHRDIKPTNILLVAGLDDDETPTEVPKVCDFGVALAWTGTSEGSLVAGTPEYMSPEQCRGLALDARSDVYACGMLMYELATGRLPFTGDDGALTARRQVTEEPARPSLHMPEIDPLFESVIMKAIAKEPAARQQSMRHLRSELRELLAPVAVSMDAAPESQSIPAPSSSASGVPPPSGDEGRENWLEVQSEGMTAFLFEHRNAYQEAEEVGAALADDPRAWLEELAATQEVTKFGAQMTLLEAIIRKIVKKADATTLSAIVTTLRRVIKEEGAVGPRAMSAGSVLRLLRDPQRLEPLVEKALGGPEQPTAAMVHVLVEPQAASAQALIDGRLRHASPAARACFITIMRAIGPASLAPLMMALRGCLDRGELDGPVVDDLLRSMPPGPSDAAGSVVAEFLRSGSADTSGVALFALAGLWGERARPLLLGALNHVGPGVVVGAIMGLRAIRAIDTHAVARLDAVLSGNATMTDAARAAAATALAEATPDARNAAAMLVTRAWAPPRTTLWSSPPPSASQDLVVALAHSLLVLGVPSAAVMIQQRAASSPDELRRCLTALLTGR